MKKTKTIRALVYSVTTSILLSGCITTLTDSDDATAVTTPLSSSLTTSSSSVLTSSMAGTSSVVQASSSIAGTSSIQTSSSTTAPQTGSSVVSTVSSSQKSYDNTQNSSGIGTTLSSQSQSSTTHIGISSSQTQIAMSSNNIVIGSPYDFNGLTIASLQTTSTLLDEYDIKYDIDDIAEFFHTPDPSDADETGEKCFTEKLVQNATNLSNGFTQYKAENLDISECMGSVYDSEDAVQLNSIKVILSSLWIIKAEDQLGMPVANINNSLLTDYEPKGKGGKAYMIRKMDMHMEISLTYDGAPLTMIADSKQIAGATSNINEPCIEDEFNNIFTNCSEYNKIIQHAAIGEISSSDTTYQEFHYKNLKLPKGGTYYTDGTIDFTHNNWSGIMSYGSNPETNPTYVVTDGNNEIQGTFNNTMSIFKRAVTNSVESTIQKFKKSLNR